MKHRVLHCILVFLLVLSAHGGSDVRPAVPGGSDGIRIVMLRAPAHECAPVLLGETNICERAAARPQKRGELPLLFGGMLFGRLPLSFGLCPASAHGVVPPRVLLLPKSLQTIIFTQTVI